MFFQSLDLTTALRPALLSEETLLFVQEAVGLYDGYEILSQMRALRLTCLLIIADRKYKIPNLQNGHAYLTSHRICYVDNLEPRKSSIAIELKNIEKYEFYVIDSCMPRSSHRLTSLGGLPQILSQNNAVSQKP